MGRDGMGNLLAMTDKYVNLFVGLAALWLFILVLGAGLWYYRRRWWLSESRSDEQPWTLADLRELRDAGGMTEEEYQKIRAAMIAGFQCDSGNSAAASDSSHSSNPSHKAEF